MLSLQKTILLSLFTSAITACAKDKSEQETGEYEPGQSTASGTLVTEVCDTCRVTKNPDDNYVSVNLKFEESASLIDVRVNSVSCLSFEVAEELLTCELPLIEPGIYDLELDFGDSKIGIVPKAVTVDLTTKAFLDGVSVPSVFDLDDNTLGDDRVSLSTAEYHEQSPFSAKILTIEGDVSWSKSGKAALFIRADIVRVPPNVDAIISVNGEQTDKVGEGGDGASGGGATGGHNNYVPPAFTGRDGGSGTDGTSHLNLQGGVSYPYTAMSSFEFGNGGRGGNGGDNSFGPGSGGDGGPQFGGGGGGGSGFQGTAGGGGGGGAGLVAIIAHSLDIEGSLKIEAKGGDGEAAPAEHTASGGGGGGGVVWVGLYTYSGQLADQVDVSGGNSSPVNEFIGQSGSAGQIHIFQILKDGSLIERALHESW